MADGGEIPLPPDENRGPEILAICGSMVGLALAAVLLRIWVRAKMVRHVGADDWTIIAAMVCRACPLSLMMCIRIDARGGGV